MKIEPATTDQIRTVARAMRDRDFAEISALHPSSTREELADALVRIYAPRSDVLCASRDGEPICIGAFILIRPRVVSLMMFATPAFPKIGFPLTRFIKKQMFPRLEAAGVHRIEAVSMAGHRDVHDWLRTLGLTTETMPLRNFGKNGEAFIYFSKVSGDVRSTGA